MQLFKRQSLQWNENWPTAFVFLMLENILHTFLLCTGIKFDRFQLHALWWNVHLSSETSNDLCTLKFLCWRWLSESIPTQSAKTAFR